MLYLTGSWPRSLGEPGPDVGLMVQPGNSMSRLIPCFPAWAADNGCYAQGDAFDPDAWLAWLDGLPRAGCLFAVAPDVVGDAAATLDRSGPWLEAVRQLGFPAGFAAQDGLEGLVVPWDTFDVLFIGGTTRWKLSHAATELIIEARRRGKWTHAGRVNSWRRLRHFAAVGTGSVDGTFLAFGPDRRRPELDGWLRRARDAPALPLWG